MRRTPIQKGCQTKKILRLIPSIHVRTLPRNLLHGSSETELNLCFETMLNKSTQSKRRDRRELVVQGRRSRPK